MLTLTLLQFTLSLFIADSVWVPTFQSWSKANVAVADEWLLYDSGSSSVTLKMEQHSYCKYFCYAESDVSGWTQSCESSHQRDSLAKWSWENLLFNFINLICACENTHAIVLSIFHALEPSHMIWSGLQCESSDPFLVHLHLKIKLNE